MSATGLTDRACPLALNRCQLAIRSRQAAVVVSGEVCLANLCARNRSGACR